MIEQKVQGIIDEQKLRFIDRDDEIHAGWIALLSRKHIWMLGVPGIGKSFLADDFTARITGANIFSYLFRKDTTNNEIFGPPSLSALKNDKYVFVTAGRLPEAHVAFLDEIFKAGSTALNSLLRILNERMFDNGGVTSRVPLLTAFTASNEMPKGEELNALYDRLLIRLHVRDLQSDTDFRRLLDLKNVPVQATITLDELLQAQKLVDSVDVSQVLDAVVELRAKILNESGLSFSSRRWREALAVVRAHAYLKGRSVATTDDLEVYQWILWDDPDHRSKTLRAVLGMVNSLNVQFLEYLDEAEEIHKKLMNLKNTNAAVAPAEALAANRAYKEIGEKMKNLIKATNGSTRERMEAGYKRVRDYNKETFTIMGVDDPNR